MSNQPRPLVLTGGLVIDSALGGRQELDVLVRDGVIEAVDRPGSFAKVVDAEHVEIGGCYLTPGLVDIHVHFREPGFEWKEDIASGSRAAAAGGFTEVCCMPNTNPIIDCAQIAEFVCAQGQRAGMARVHPIGAITVGSKGEALAPFGELRDAGCVAFSDDGRPVFNSLIMRRALEYASMFDAVLTVHEEDLDLSRGFSMNESALSVQLGLVGMPDAAENVMIARDIELARLTGGRVHFCHVSTARGVTLIRRAKEDGIPVTAEVAPHHFTLDESSVRDFDTTAKMSMPLRSQEDISALLAGLADGTIDAIASDHAPHEADSKNVAFSQASFGILGLQTTVPLTLARVRDGSLTLERAIDALTARARAALNLPPLALQAGNVADLCVIDPKKRLTLTKEMILSKSKNTPFIGCELEGVCVQTILAGRIVFQAN